VVLAVWEAAAQAHLVKPYLLPAPSAVAATLWRLLLKGTVPRFLGFSLQHYVLGLAWGVAAGIALGLATGWFRWADVALEPLIGLLRPIPPIAWTPFAIIWIGINTSAAAFLIAIGAFYLTFFATYAGVKGVDPRMIEVARTLGDRSNRRLLWRVVVPAALPSILVGVRTSLGQGWMTMVAAEMFGVQGLGMKMFEAAGLLAMDSVIAYMVVIGAVYFATDRLFRWTERRLLRWR